MLLQPIQKICLRALKVVKQPLIRNILIVGVITLLIKAIGFYKDALVIGTFGLSEFMDTFAIAFLVPSFIQNVFINALKNIFIPNYINELKSEGNIGQFQSIVFIITFFICLFFFIIVLIFYNNFLGVFYPNNSESYYSLINQQILYLLPCLFFWGFSSLIGGLLEIDSKFLFTSISPVFLAISVIVCVTFFKETLGDNVLVIGILTGSATGFTYLLSIALFYKKLQFKYPKFSKHSREMLKQLPPKVSSGLLSGLNNFIDQFFAAQLVIGSITAINYGIKIPAFLVGILILAVGNVLLPHFSRLINENLLEAYHQLFKILKIVFITSSVLVIISFFFSDEIVKLLYERQKFSSDDTQIVSDLQKIAFIYVPFYLCTLVTVRFLTSINKNKFMAWVSLSSLILNIILNTILIRYYKVYGLVMATTVIYIITSFIYIYYTRKQYKLSKLAV